MVDRKRVIGTRRDVRCSPLAAGAAVCLAPGADTGANTGAAIGAADVPPYFTGKAQSCNFGVKGLSPFTYQEAMDLSSEADIRIFEARCLPFELEMQ